MLKNPHTQTIQSLIQSLQTSPQGLTSSQVKERLALYGLNELPVARRIVWFFIFLRQFTHPFISILLIIATITLILGHFSESFFIFGVLLFNALISSVQEHSAEKSAAALKKMTSLQAKVKRDGRYQSIASCYLVPGDIVQLVSGDKIPADLRWISTQNLYVNESILTGESLPLLKSSETCLQLDTPLAERVNLGFSGTWVTQGRAEGLILSTGKTTELGKIAQSLSDNSTPQSPLTLRMEKFSKELALSLLVIIILLSLILLIQGESLQQVLFYAISLGISAIPEGLPIALTSALAVASYRMAQKKVLVKELVSVEALGSCTYIGTDKTGTLTLNEMTVKGIAFPDIKTIAINGEGFSRESTFLLNNQPISQGVFSRIQELASTALLCSEINVSFHEGKIQAHGDAVDVALCILAHQAGVSLQTPTPISQIPFESEHRFCAALHAMHPEGPWIAVKGAPEAIFPMCHSMKTDSEQQPIDLLSLQQQSQTLSQSGFRILAIAKGKPFSSPQPQSLASQDLQGLCFLGFIAMIDPLRPDAKQAIADCQSAGIRVGIMTGDHPLTALAIAKELGLTSSPEEVISGSTLKKSQTQEQFDEYVARGQVFARVEPQQKLSIVQSLIRQGHFVAVTGDGANDAPALNAAHVGVAMGEKATDVAKEAAQLMITDDRFSTWVAGIQEGRVAFSNIQRVLQVLLSFSLAQILLFLLAMLTQLPIPLTPIQLLWLNFVTDGIQVIALAFEPAQGHELRLPPRSPQAPLLDAQQRQKILVSAFGFSLLMFLIYATGFQHPLETYQGRNHLLLAFIILKNVFILHSSAKKSFLRLQNPFLGCALLGTLALHAISMQIPWMRSLLGIQPLDFITWFKYLIFSGITIHLIHLLFRKSSGNQSL